MRALRRILVCCLLLALPVQLLAAVTPCCPAETPSSHGDAHSGMAHADHVQAPAQAEHPCGEAGDGPQGDCDAMRCAMHCAHAPTLAEQASVRSPPASGGPHFPAPAVGVDDVAPSPRLRPPIPVHC